MIRYYTVVGWGEFPIDMLRYDSAFPADAHAVAAIAQRLHQERPLAEKVEVRLGSPRLPTFDRWRSFGWTVKVEVKIRLDAAQ